MNLDPSTAILTGGEVPSQTTPPNPGHVNFITMAELLSRPSPKTKWIVDGLLPTGGTSLLSAKPRVGKSTLVRNLLVSVARGEPFLGRPTTQTPVAYLCLEEIESMVKDSFVQLGARPDDPIFVHMGDVDPRCAADEVADFIKSHGPGLVVVDTLGKFLPILDFNDYGKVNAMMSAVTSLLRQSPETHLMFLHHSKKSEEGEDNYLGSVAFHGNVDVFFRMFKSGSHHVISARQQRYGIDLEQTRLDMDPGTTRLSVSGAPSKEEATDARMTMGLIEALKTGPKTWRALRDAVRGNNTHLARIRDGLVSDGLIVQDPDMAFRLKN